MPKGSKGFARGAAHPQSRQSREARARGEQPTPADEVGEPPPGSSRAALKRSLHDERQRCAADQCECIVADTDGNPVPGEDCSAEDLPAVWPCRVVVRANLFGRVLFPPVVPVTWRQWGLLILTAVGWCLAGKAVSKVCCRYWCTSCLLHTIVTTLPRLPACRSCQAALTTVQTTDFTDDGSLRVQTARPPPVYKWKIATRIRRWLTRPGPQRHGDMAVQVWWHPREATYTHDAPVVFQSVLPSDVGLSRVWADDSKNAVTVLLVHLHSKIFGTPRTASGAADCQSLADFQQVARSATAPLSNILMTLATGDPIKPAVERLAKNFFDRKGLNAVQIAVDVLSKANCNEYIGPTQSLVHWVAHNNDKSQRELILSALALSSSSGRLNRKQQERLFNEYMKRPRNKTGPEIFTWGGGDNCGWRQPAGGDADGGGSGFDPWYIPIQYHCTRTELKSLGRPGQNLLLPQFHERKADWEKGVDSVFGLSEDDGKYMRARRRETHRWACDVARTIALRGGINRKSAVLLRNLTMPLHWATPYREGDPPVCRLCTTRRTESTAMSHLEAEGAQTDFACHADPAKNEVLEYILNQQRECMEDDVRRHGGDGPDGARALDEHGQILFPAAWMRLYLETDGKPARQVQVMQEKQAAQSEEYHALYKSELIEGIVQFPGGFHIYKAALADVGTCGAAVSGPLAWLFLKTEGRVAYFQDPSDPRVPLLRWRQILMATEVEILHWASKGVQLATGDATRFAGPEEVEAYIKTVSGVAAAGVGVRAARVVFPVSLPLLGPPSDAFSRASCPTPSPAPLPAVLRLVLSHKCTGYGSVPRR